MPISKDTQLCISVAQHPSNFGTTLFNAAFQKLGLDFVYKAMRVRPGDLRAAIEGIRALGIRGCGVSMPFKGEAAGYMDNLDSLARKIGAVNTIVNTAGRLKGYNTDCWGAWQVLKRVKGLRSKRIVMLGAGGVAQAIACALVKLGASDVTVVNREQTSGKSLARKWGFSGYLAWRERDGVDGDVLINATPVGMAPHSQRCPVGEDVVGRFSVVMDVVINPSGTRLIKLARRRGRRVIPGHEMSLWQAARQFELYMGRRAPVKVMREQILNM